MIPKEILPGKLVRDKIPQIMEAGGQTPVTKVLSDEEFGQALRDKLIEEAEELRKARDKATLIEELADVSEIIETILETEGVSPSQVKKVQLEKRKERGGFKQKLLLLPPPQSSL